MERRDEPARSPREISSRSATESRNGDRVVLRGGMPPVAFSRRWMAFFEHPTAVETSPKL